MGLFDTIAALQKMAESPELENTAAGIGRAALALPDLLHSIDEKLGVIIYHLATNGARLTEISLGLDAAVDPIRRPPFGVSDVEAMMRASPGLARGPDLEEAPDGK